MKKVKKLVKEQAKQFGVIPPRSDQQPNQNAYGAQPQHQPYPNSLQYAYHSGFAQNYSQHSPQQTNFTQNQGNYAQRPQHTPYYASGSPQFGAQHSAPTSGANYSYHQDIRCNTPRNTPPPHHGSNYSPSYNTHGPAPSAPPRPSSHAPEHPPPSENYGTQYNPPRQSPDECWMGERFRLPPSVLDGAIQRFSAARRVFGNQASMEASKGLSRVLELNDPADIDRFGYQLRNADRELIAVDYSTAANNVIVFALSYVQNEIVQGRYKFSEQQWYDLKTALVDLGRAGVPRIRLWFDQCLYLRDTSQRSWAHIGILPYAIWPVLSLGTKFGGVHDRTIATTKRFWPFLEEIAGLWGGGVVTTRELRTLNSPLEDNCKSYTLNRRSELPPAKTLRVVLLNVFHGAADNLRTGWREDVLELQEMARLNVMYGTEIPVIGADWRQRLGAQIPNDAPGVLDNLMPLAAPEEQDRDEEEAVPVYLDKARQVPHTGKWDGVLEFMSGNAPAREFTENGRNYYNVESWHAQTEQGVFRLLCISQHRQSTYDSVHEVWLLASCKVDMTALAGANPGAAIGAGVAAMVMPFTLAVVAGVGFGAACMAPNNSAKISQKLGNATKRVAFKQSVDWTKVMHGKSACYLRRFLRSNSTSQVEAVISEQLGGAKVRIQRLEQCVHDQLWQRRYTGKVKNFIGAMSV